MFHLDSFHFLRVTNITSLERLVKQSSAASHLTQTLFSQRSPYQSPLLISLCYLISEPFVFQPSFSLQVLPDLEKTKDSTGLPGESLRLLTCLTLCLLPQSKFSNLALPLLYGALFSSMRRFIFQQVPALIIIFLACCCCYPTPSEGWGHGGRPWSSRSRATLQGLNQR